MKICLKKKENDMKRNVFLKKIIGALCVGALCVGAFISMPVTANAAEKKDVVGDWTGWLDTRFYENGMAEDRYNTRAYHMQSGSLTVKYNDGTTETVNYDLWRGEEIGNVAQNKYADAVIYKIIEPGKMQAWNVVKENGESEWKAPYGVGILTKKTDTGSKASADTGSTSPARKCEHSYEWSITTEPTETADGVSSYICTSCGDVKARQPISADVVIREKLLASIKNAKEGTTVTFDNKAWSCYPQYVLDALKEKGNISLKTDFTYEGKNYSFIIPAGSDYTNLEQADFYGFMYLFGAFDGIIVG